MSHESRNGEGSRNQEIMGAFANGTFPLDAQIAWLEAMQADYVVEVRERGDEPAEGTAMLLAILKSLNDLRSSRSERRDTERLLWVMNEMRESFLHDFVSHVLRRGGAGDISDCRTWIDTKMGADHDGAKP